MATNGAGAAFDDLGRRLLLAGPGAVVVAAAGYCSLALARRGNQPAAAFALLLMGLAFYLLLGAELFHIVDSFGGAWRRMNTVFKFYYQVWLLLGIVSAFALYSLLKRKDAKTQRRKEVLCICVFASLRPCVFTPPDLRFLLLHRRGYHRPQQQQTNGHRTLDGLAFLRESDPGEYAAIVWLRDEAEPGRIVEAVGDDYSDYGRISAATGRASPLGWKGHEIQWRGSHEAFAGRGGRHCSHIFGNRRWLGPAVAGRL